MADPRHPVHNANDGQYGTMVWRAGAPKESGKKPWVEIRFPKAKSINRFRFSSNREYFFETDYLSEGNSGRFPAYRILARQADGSWQEVANTHKAEAKLKNIPFFARSQARQRIEAIAREADEQRITVELVEQVRLQFGQ